IQIHTVVSEPFAENSYIVWRDGGTEAFVIDPGFEPDAIRDVLTERELKLAAIVCTHGHVDHIAGNADLKRAFPDVPIVIGRVDFPGGSFETLKAGIERVLWPLPPDTVVYPGHGPVTTIGHEKRTNPYVGTAADEST